MSEDARLSESVSEPESVNEPATEAEADAPMSPRAKVVTALFAVVVIVLSAWLMVRMSSPRIAPEQAAPAGHYPLSCGLCHSISDKAKVMKVGS